MFKDSDSIPAVPETSKALTPSWKVKLPAGCNDPDQAEELYHDARSWVAELRGRTEPPAYPLRTLMNVVNVADLIRDNFTIQKPTLRQQRRSWSSSISKTYQYEMTSYFNGYLEVVLSN